MTATDYLVWGMVAHLVADWFLQNDWQAAGKVKFFSFPAWAHGWCHFWCLALVFGPWCALALTLVHMWIDTRRPLEVYRQMVGQAREGNPVAVHVKIWQDQAAHVLCIAMAAWLLGGGS